MAPKGAGRSSDSERHCLGGRDPAVRDARSLCRELRTGQHTAPSRVPAVRHSRPALSTYLCATLALVFASLYLYGAVVHLNVVNTDMTRGDQQSYMRYARKLKTEEGFLGDRNRMPLYPWVQSHFYHESLTEDAYFLQSRFINIALSLAVLPLLHLLMRRYLDRLTSASLVLVTAFTVFLFKASYVQSEITFYTLDFLSYLLLLAMFSTPSWRLGVAAGLTLGLSHLTKASVLPGMALFCLCYSARFFWRWATATLRGMRRPRWLTTFVPVIMMIVIFLAILSPYLANSKRRFGRYFHNVNSTFYVWYDSWEEVKEGTRAHGDRKGWPDLPADEIPSLVKYLREHTPEEMAQRVIGGLRTIGYYSTHTYGYHKYVALYVLFVACAVASNQRGFWRLVRQRAWVALFAIAYFGCYAILYAWYVPIAGPGDRFVLGQFLPLMLTLAWLVQRVNRPIAIASRGGMRVECLKFMNIVTLLILLPDIYLILSIRILSVYGGS